jgi:hypothetical protein
MSLPYDFNHLHTIVLTECRDPVHNLSLIGFFPTERGCLTEMVKNPWLETHMGRADPLVCQFKARKDLKAFKTRLPTFAKRGSCVIGEASQ